MVEFTVRVYRDKETKKVKREIKYDQKYNYYPKSMSFNRLWSDLFKG